MLSQPELSMTLITLLCAKFILSYPCYIVRNSGSAAWIEMLYVTLIALILFFITTRIYTRKKSVIELAHMKFGKWGRIITGLICFLILFMNFTGTARIFSESVKIILLHDTNVDLIIALFMLFCSFGARYGIKSVSKINYMFLPIAGFIFAAFLLLLFGDYKFENITPVFGYGFKRIFVHGFNSIYVFSDIIVLNLLMADSGDINHVKKSGFIAIIISGLVGAVICAAYNLIFPYTVSDEFVMPVYQLTRIINISSFFNRFEAIFQFAWSVLILIYGVIYIYILCYVWQITFSLKYYKPIIFPVTMLCGASALLSRSLMRFMQSSHSFEAYVYPAAFLLPIIIGLITKKKEI